MHTNSLGALYRLCQIPPSLGKPKIEIAAADYAPMVCVAHTGCN